MCTPTGDTSLLRQMLLQYKKILLYLYDSATNQLITNDMYIRKQYCAPDVCSEQFDLELRLLDLSTTSGEDLVSAEDDPWI